MGKELNGKVKEAPLARGLFSEISPWETVKSLLSFLVTDGVSDPEEQLDIGICDSYRAPFMPKADRELYIEIPDEAKAPGESRCCGTTAP